MRFAPALGLLLASATASAQPHPQPASAFVTLGEGTDSTRLTGEAEMIVDLPGASWVRLHFGEVVLPGDPAGDGWIIVLTSLADGAQQHLTSEQLAYWNNSSAYFNGQSVRVELASRGHAGTPMVEVVGATHGNADGGGGNYDDRTICGLTDDRVISADAAVARTMPAGCSAWLISDQNHSFLSAGHCVPGAGSVMEFNVPLSGVAGAIVHPPPRDQYPVDPISVQSAYVTVGNDWSYFGCFPNSETGLTPYQAQGACFDLAASLTAPAGQSLRVTGFGAVFAPTLPFYNHTQRTHAGAFTATGPDIVYHTADTTSGNSGSPIFLNGTRTAIAIHTNAGCTVLGGANAGTAVTNAGLRAALAAPRGVCATGSGAPPCIPVDFDGDGNLGGFDYEFLMRVVGGTEVHPDADVNHDGNLDGFDLETYERHLGGDCS